ncbi:hypothetical protein [Actinoplanes sp. NPDC026619]|uniref:hypothetical protein n=1 Tax=Actinoplanes sp. NPDC026619 TaxID=3155798 RepID=UPI0034069560
MKRMLSARVLIVAGCVAAVSAVLFGAAGVAIFGEEMLPNLFAELHLAEFRSNIEGFAGSLDPSSHESLRKIDRRLTWAIARLGAEHQSPGELQELTELVSETADFIATFLARNGGPAFHEAEQSALRALENTGPDPVGDSEGAADRSFRRRLQAQTEFLRIAGRSRPTPRGILFDPDNELAFGYFSIDRAILAGKN